MVQLQLADLRRCGWTSALVPIAPGQRRPGLNGTDALGWQTKIWPDQALDGAAARGFSFGIKSNVLPSAFLDVDAEGECADAGPIIKRVMRKLWPGAVCRGRPGSPRYALVVRADAVGASKRVWRFARGGYSFGVELFHGSGYLAATVHHSGVAYEWSRAPDLSKMRPVAVDADAVLEAIKQALSSRGYALDASTTQGNGEALERDPALDETDPLYQALVARKAVLFKQSRGGFTAIECPFAAEHSGTNGQRRRRDSSTSYLPPLAGSEPGAIGYIKCLHASCADRTQADYLAALGVDAWVDPTVAFPMNPDSPLSAESTFQYTHAGTLGAQAVREVGAPCRSTKPEPMAVEAHRGVFGEAARLIANSCEASPDAILMQLLAAMSAIPERAGVSIGGPTPGSASLQLVLVGPTGQGRKGTAWRFVKRLLELAFPDFVNGIAPDTQGLIVPAPSRMLYGLSSGEGIVYAIRDARQVGRDVDPGVDDKRLLIVVEEFSLLLKVARREGNTLSEVLRAIHDNGPLQFPTRREPLYAARSHVAAVAHCTVEELTAQVAALDLVNGALNRWLFAHSERTRISATSPELDMQAFGALAAMLRERLCAYAYQPGSDWHQRALPLTAKAQALWDEELYDQLDAGSRRATANGLTVRYPAQCKRIALMYALADGAKSIGTQHLIAAAAVLAYCEASTRFIFGGDQYPDIVTQRIADLLREAQGVAIPRASLWKVLGHRVTAQQIDRAISTLIEDKVAKAFQAEVALANGQRPFFYSWAAA